MPRRPLTGLRLGRRRWLAWLLLLAGIIAFRPAVPAAAQAPVPSYWRYEAFGRLDLLEVADVNHDGMDEFVLVSEERDVALVSSAGEERWVYRADTPVLFLATANVHGAAEPRREIVLATASALLLLDSEGDLLWEAPLPLTPIDVAAFATGVEGREEILIAGAQSELILYDAQGRARWSYFASADAAGDVPPSLLVADVDHDGQSEAALGYYVTRGFSQLVLVNSRGQEIWKRSLSGRITAMAPVGFAEDGPLSIAVGTFLQANRTFVILYETAGGRELFYRTPNKQVTSLAQAQLPEGRALLVGTAVGTVIAYDQSGRRFWTRNYWETPDRRITAISALPEGPAGGSQRFSLAVTLAPAPGNTSSDLLVLNSEGRVLETVTSVSVTGLTRLTDINRDEQAELLLVRFAALELLDPGIGTRQNLPGWSYSLDAQPQAALIADVDRDGRDELVVGSSDGRLHILKAGESVAASPDITVASLGGFITQIALADLGTEGPPELVVVRNTITADEELRERFEGSLMVLRPDGRVVWEKTLPTQITSLLVDDINNSTRPELIIGTNDGQLVTFSLAGEEFWRGSVNGSVEHLVTIDGQRNGRIEIVAATSAGELYKYNNKGTIVIQLAAYLADITSLQRIDQTGELRAQLVVTVDDGTVRGLNWRGIELPSWIRQTEGLPILSLPASRSFLIATDEASLLRLDHDNTLLWSLGGHGIIKSLYWGDLDGDARADIAAGNRDGELLLFTGDGDGPWERLSVGSGVFFVSSLQGTEVDQTQLVVVSDNGEVRQFRAQVNRPPLLMNAQTQSDRGQYTVNVTVEDVEQDAVTVSLEVLDPIGETWLPQGARPVQGSGTLFWTLDPALAENGLVYRFHYSDASQQGTVGPLPGVPAVATPASPDGLALATILVVALLASAYGIVYATRAEPYRARRVYKQLRGEGEATLTYLGEAYSRHRAAPDFLLSLANLARQDNDRRLAGLCDGLFLLADRPEAALKILTTSLEEAGADGVAWRQLELWHNTMRLGHELLSAPNITELSLLRPQLVELLQLQLDADEASPSIASLLPILTALRDSERVDLADDRLVYLHEALVLIRQLQEQLLTWPMRVSSQMAAAIAYRWEGYVNAGIEELRGQARLSVVLRTRRLAPQPDGITIALEIANAGRAAAENISLRLLPDPAYEAPREPVHFAVLPPGRTRQVHLPLRPRVSDRFRLTLEVTYDDRHQTEKRLAFADLVHLLAPVRQFTPIANPYLPGTPLRRNSPLFFGRQDLFEFIARNAGRPEQRNVIILTGQRRTGKNSALLRL